MQQPTKSKQRRNRTSSEGQKRQQQQQHQQQHGGGGFTKVFTNSGGSRELQSLLNMPPQQAPTQQQLFEANLISGYQHQQQQQPNQGQGKRRGGNNNGSHNNNNGGGQNMNNRTDFDTANNEDEESIRLNSSALRRIDKDFCKLHGTASQVAVYRYNSVGSWDKTDTVGCLFLYERSSGPRYGLVVMNRKNANNFIQCFGSDGQVVLQTPYLLLRSGEDLMREDAGDGSQVIHCIWFYDLQDCLSSANILRSMGLKFEGGEGMMGMGGGGGGGSSGGGGMSGSQQQQAGAALFQMLQPKESPGPNPVKLKGGVMTAEELESQMMEEDHPGPVILGSVPPPASVSTASSVFQQFADLTVKGSNGHGNGGTAQVAAAAEPAVLSPLTISQNKMRTVEQLERQMKERNPVLFHDPTAAIQNELINTLGISHSCKSASPSSYPPGGGGGVLPFAGGKSNTVALLANSVIDKCVDDVHPEDLRKLMEVMDPSDLVLVTVPGPEGGVNCEPKLIWRMRQQRSSPLTNNGSTASTFTTPTGEFVSASGTPLNTNSHLGGPGPDHRDVQRQRRPSPLNKEQMQKALIHLIQNDNEFMTQIHEAYVQTVEQQQRHHPQQQLQHHHHQHY